MKSRRSPGTILMTVMFSGERRGPREIEHHVLTHRALHRPEVALGEGGRQSGEEFLSLDLCERRKQLHGNPLDRERSRLKYASRFNRTGVTDSRDIRT